MSTEYLLNFYDTSGVAQYQIDNYTWLTYTKRLNHPGMIQFGLPFDSPVVADIADKWLIKVLRDGEDEITGIYRWLGGNYENIARATYLANGIMSMLDWHEVAYHANYANRSIFSGVPVETIMKTLVNYNCGAAALTTNGRLRNGVFPQISIATDQARGGNQDWACAHEQVLATLQDLARATGHDFDLIDLGGANFQFEFYVDHKGQDKTDSVTFSLEQGNMSNIAYIDARNEERTVAIVGGYGEEAARDFVIRTGDNYAYQTNDIEVFVNASDLDEGDTSGLNARGDATLAEAKAYESFSFEVTQVDGCRYKKHYDVGDVVTVINPFTGGSSPYQVIVAQIGYSDKGKESIHIELEAH